MIVICKVDVAVFRNVEARLPVILERNFLKRNPALRKSQLQCFISYKIPEKYDLIFDKFQIVEAVVKIGYECRDTTLFLNVK